MLPEDKYIISLILSLAFALNLPLCPEQKKSAGVKTPALEELEGYYDDGVFILDKAMSADGISQKYFGTVKEKGAFGDDVPVMFDQRNGLYMFDSNTPYPASFRIINEGGECYIVFHDAENFFQSDHPYKFNYENGVLTLDYSEEQNFAKDMPFNVKGKLNVGYRIEGKVLISGTIRMDYANFNGSKAPDVYFVDCTILASKTRR